MKKTIILLCAILFVSASHSQQQEKIDHLKTFAKAYGYVKYFHPSNEASEIDWNKFAALGAHEILKCHNRKEVIATLNSLFQPMAPGVIFSNSKQNYNIKAITPSNTEIYEPVYWQHKGVSKDMYYYGQPYTSSRVNSYTEIDESNGFGTLTLSIDPEKYQGKEIKYTGWVKLKEGSEGTAHLWLRVDKSDKTRGFFENMGNTPITSKEWKQYEIIGEIDELASSLFMGSLLIGKGTLYLDDVHLYYKEQNEWVEIPIKNSGFEAQSIGEKNQDTEWIGKSKGYSYALSNTEHIEGKTCAVINFEGQLKEVKGEPLFDAFPKFGELIEKEIGEGIICQIPLSLYGNAEHTYPKSETFNPLLFRLQNFDALNTTYMYLGNVINTYNVFQHFYPYFDEVDVDWDKELEIALRRSLNDHTEKDHLITLEKFTAPLKDGHIFVSSPKYAEYVPPIKWEWIEDKLIITKVGDENLGIKIGDVVTKVNNQLSADYFKEVNSRISAGTQGYLNYRAEITSLLGEKNEELLIEINQKNFVLNRDRKLDYLDHNIRIQENNYKVLDENIYYLNLSTIEMDTITELLPQLQQAKGIICDLRGYPNGNDDFISHLLKEKDTSKAWMRIPKIIYPDHEKITGFEKSGWEIQAKKPYLGDKSIVFIIDGRSISYAESYMSFIEGYKLATIVGQPTAGTNGNVNPFTLLGNYNISWTGMKVVKHDGTQLHGIGILPDFYVNKTIEGIKQEKDEFLDKAIEVILN
ncbi:S41 family peptidase [Gelidibacter sp.]|uniref:S41 family peptidase n=1 Tax=Gelidibacter sp. TaxID=2018083 RepID=UPI002B57D359|nr:S41 family peptidase [Gelidibacter sp.]HUH27369.1 S41 family peptidase [Gelidibacter sp.]